MLRAFFLVTILSGSGPALASCPDFLDHGLRKLHSTERVNLCQVGNRKAMLIVNTASHCGYTPQFKQLEALHQRYREQGLVIVGFASDDFRQEAKDEEQTAAMCYINYGVTFTMLAPTHVRGDAANPVFRELARQTTSPSWNFNKYLVNTAGDVVMHFGSNTAPDDPLLIHAIDGLLRPRPLTSDPITSTLHTLMAPND